MQTSVSSEQPSTPPPSYEESAPVFSSPTPLLSMEEKEGPVALPASLIPPKTPEELQERAKKYVEEAIKTYGAADKLVESNRDNLSAELMEQLFNGEPQQDPFAVFCKPGSSTRVFLHQMIKPLLRDEMKESFKKHLSSLKNAKTPEERDSYSNSLTLQMFYAVVLDDIDMLSVLFKHSKSINRNKQPNRLPDINALVPGDQNYSVLHLALVCNASLPLLERLVKVNANLSSKDVNGRTPIHLAILLRNWPAVEMFLRVSHSDRDLWNTTDNFGLSPLALMFMLDPRSTHVVITKNMDDNELVAVIEEKIMTGVINILLDEVRVNIDLLAPVLNQFTDPALCRLLNKRTFFHLINAKVAIQMEEFRDEMNFLKNINKRNEELMSDQPRINGHIPAVSILGTHSKPITLETLQNDTVGSTLSGPLIQIQKTYDRPVWVESLVVSSGSYVEGCWGHKYLCGAMVYVSLDELNWVHVHTINVQNGNPITVIINRKVRAVKIERATYMQIAQFYLL